MLHATSIDSWDALQENTANISSHLFVTMSSSASVRTDVLTSVHLSALFRREGIQFLPQKDMPILGFCRLSVTKDM